MVLMMVLACSAMAEAGFSLTTGLPTDKAQEIMVVQLDNEPKARPQKGIASADIVYEVELYNGGYTRYTAVFNDQIPELVEAVRSARVVNADIYSEYQGAFVHFGARVEPDSNLYDYLNKHNYTADLDGNNHNGDKSKVIYKVANMFYRDSGRAAPNNVVGKLQQMHDMVDWSQLSCRSPLKFNEYPTIPAGEDVNKFQIQYREGSYVPSYQWDASQGKYLRFYNGNPYKDGTTGEQVTCDNIIVQHVRYEWYGGKSEAPHAFLYEGNTCDYFIGGKHFTGTWKRDSISNNTVYLDDAGNEVYFNPGHTYIEILKLEKSIDILG